MVFSIGKILIALAPPFPLSPPPPPHTKEILFMVFFRCRGRGLSRCPGRGVWRWGRCWEKERGISKTVKTPWLRSLKSTVHFGPLHFSKDNEFSCVQRNRTPRTPPIFNPPVLDPSTPGPIPQTPGPVPGSPGPVPGYRDRDRSRDPRGRSRGPRRRQLLQRRQLLSASQTSWLCQNERGGGFDKE